MAAEDATTSSKAFNLDRSYRLLSAVDFDHVFTAARRSADRFFTVLYRDNELGFARIGFVVAKKKVPRAVARNRLRRIGRESFRRERPKLGGIDIIILAQASAARAGNADLFASLAAHWRNLQARKDQQRQQRRAKDKL